MRITGGALRGRRFHPPRDRSVRPALERQREMIFSLLTEEVEGSRVLDLFAGVGAFGLESLSRGARHVHFVDRSREALEILRRNLRELGLESYASSEFADALVHPDAAGRTSSGTAALPDAGLFDLVFLDPPFPLFRESKGVEQIWRRIEGLRSAPVLATSATIVLRTPRAYREDPPIIARDTRREGESVIHLFDRADPAGEADPAT